MSGPLISKLSTLAPHWLRDSPIARRLVLATIALSTAIALFATAWQLYLDYSHDMTYIENTLVQIKRAHVPTIAAALWSTNSKELQITVDGIAQLPDVEYVAIYDGKTIWARHGEQHDNKGHTITYTLQYHHRNKLYNIGELRVSINMGAVYSRLFTKLWTILLLNAFKTFVVASFLLWLFHKQVTRHVHHISEYAQELGARDWQTVLTLKRLPATPEKQDEFDVLVSAMNSMRERLSMAINELTASEARYRGMFEHANDAIFIVELNSGRILDVNQRASEVFGYSRDELLTMTVAQLSSVDSSAEVIPLMDRMKREKCAVFTRILRCKNGRDIPVEVSSRLIELGGEAVIQSFVRDISERRRMENEINAKVKALAESEQAQRILISREQQEHARLISLLAAMNIGILFEDMIRRVIYVNPAFRRLWLIEDSIELVGHSSAGILQYSANVVARSELISDHILHTSSPLDVTDTLEIALEDGRTLTQLSYPVQDEAGTYIGRLWVYEDITRERQTAEQLIYLAERDSLTGLYNRHRFRTELDRMLAESERRNKQGALLFFDLDEFKYVNDTFGHRAGDAMLIRVAGEVSTLVRRNEIIARLGGDEFAVLIPDANETEATRLAERIVRTISQIPFHFEDHNLRLTTSLGIAIYPLHATSVEEFIARADTAMYQAKEAGKNAWRVYRPDRGAAREVLSRLSWHDRICLALENDQLHLHFQGIYHSATQQLSHLEALVRMADNNHPNGVIMPGHFIPSAEKTGTILDIDCWVIRECIQILAQLPALPAIAVNISGRSIDDPGLPQFIADMLKASGVDPSRLMVELTETAAVSDLQDAQRFIEALHSTGCQVCLDDFGSGFSSFAYLKHLKADILKIDGIFIRDLAADRDNQVFVKSIVDVARGLHKVTVAEFVEDAATLELLRNFGVHLVQGYLLDKPVALHPSITELAEKANAI